MIVDNDLVMRMLEASTKNGFTSWENLGRPHGFGEAARYIQINELADDVRFLKGGSEGVRGVYMRLNSNGQRFIDSQKAP